MVKIQTICKKAMELGIRYVSTTLKIKILFIYFPTLALFTASHAQTLDKAKLDHFFDRLAEKNKAMGSLTIAKDGNILYARSIGYGQISVNGNKPLTDSSRYRIASGVIVFAQEMSLSLLCASVPANSKRVRMQDLTPGKELIPEIKILDIDGTNASVKTWIAKYSFFDYINLSKAGGKF